MIQNKGKLCIKIVTKIVSFWSFLTVSQFILLIANHYAISYYSHIEGYNKKINLTRTAICESEREWYAE